MAIKKINKLIAVTILAALLLGFAPAAAARAEGQVAFSATVVENHFPDELVFQVEVSSPGAEIISAKFAYTSEGFYGSRAFTKDPIEFTPGNTVSLEYTLDTRDMTTPPMMSYLYHWEVVDAAGNKYQSEEILIRYEDIRFDWQVLANEAIGVWWHDRQASFGEEIFEITSAGVAAQEELFQTELPFQILIVISNSSDEFNSWHALAHDWVGGETFNDYGITNQIVESSDQGGWLASVIPHEISHIYFNHVVYNPRVSVPVWLNEGVAQYNEFASHEWEEGQVETAAITGALLPLRVLENGFGSYDVNRVYLSYAEAYSAAAYLIGKYGSQGLSALLAEYQAGKPSQDAFPNALGISLDQFELDWAASVGAEDYQIPTQIPLPTFLPSPTAYIPGESGTPEPDPSPLAEDPGLPDADRISTRLPLVILIGLFVVVIFSSGAIYFAARQKRGGSG